MTPCGLFEVEDDRKKDTWKETKEGKEQWTLQQML